MTRRKRRTPEYYVWFDTEYSSLEMEEAALLQVAALITDSSLRRVLPREQDVRLIIRPQEGTKLSPWVERNLPGLVRACRSESAWPSERRTSDFLPMPMRLQFPAFEDAKAWYESPAYREACKHRFAGADYRAMIVEGA
jgi:hypothetical protein